jgi:hypothetical protein
MPTNIGLGLLKQGGRIERRIRVPPPLRVDNLLRVRHFSIEIFAVLAWGHWISPHAPTPLGTSIRPTMQVIVTGGAGFIGWRPLIARGDALDRRGLRKTA